MQLHLSLDALCVSLRRFSTKYWMSQTCTVCGKGMLFGLKCKNCKYGAVPELFVSLFRVARGITGVFAGGPKQGLRQGQTTQPLASSPLQEALTRREIG